MEGAKGVGYEEGGRGRVEERCGTFGECAVWVGTGQCMCAIDFVQGMILMVGG